MSLDKSIGKGTEHRRPYYKICYIVDYSCRNHGGKTKRRSGGQCKWCLGNRMYQTKKEIDRVNHELEDQS